MEFLLHTTTLFENTRQWNYLGTTIVLRSNGQWNSFNMLPLLDSSGKRESFFTLPHFWGAMGNRTPSVQCHTIGENCAMGLFQYTPHY